MRKNHYTSCIKYVALAVTAVAAIVSQAEIIIPNTPLVTQISTPPMVMLVASKDHKLFFEAYNDASDLDGDGKLDLRFKPSITYYGLFDSKVCYVADGSGTTGLFKPSSNVGSLNTCSGASEWSGNWLNYVTTSRIDALRKVLYGGHRDVDSKTETILRRAYIPQDAHSWAKEYSGAYPAVTNAQGVIVEPAFKISDYTPLDEPEKGKRHFFGNLTANASTNCATLDTCSNLPPLLSVVTNSSKRVWEWASKERVVLDDSHGGTRTNYTVRAQVCTASFHEGCKQYGTTSAPIYKPTGLLHDYGENDAMLFGLLTGSYNNNMSGGVLRKAVSSFKSEVDSNTGQFTADATIVDNFNKLRIRNFNNGRTDASYRNGSYRTGVMLQGDYPDWGNPVGEMMYETLRYFAGKPSPTPAFDTSGGHDGAVGLSRVGDSWSDPFTGADTDKTKSLRCARPNMLVMSDVYSSYDADQVPGSAYSSTTDTINGLTLSIADLLKTISSEPGVKGQRFIGQSTSSNLDYAPTAKTVDSLATVRGLAPEETTKQGSYSAAAIAYFGRNNDISAAANDAGTQNVSTYSLALSSTLPKIEVPINGKTISIVPFAKTIDGASTNRAKGYYQPTDQIVDLYVTKDDLAGDSKEMIFQINYEADEQGNDFDMDVVAQYTVKANSDNTVTVTVEVKYQSTGSNQNVGYVISGTNRDGIYLVAQDKNEALGYFLNVPPDGAPPDPDIKQGYCESVVNIAKLACQKLPYLGGADPKSVKTFAIGTGTAGEFLRDPLWYAAKWGGFKDSDAVGATGYGIPDKATEWDTDSNGVPDNYFLVQNPLYLSAALKKAFDGIADANSSASNVLANSTSISDSTRVFQARFNSDKWAGDLVAYPISGAGVGTATSWKAQDVIPAPGARKLFIRTTDDTTTSFTWANLSTAEPYRFDTDPSTTVNNSEDVVNYLRGVRSKEVRSGGTLRNRINTLATDVAPLGDIVHSSPFYEKDTDLLYVGGNDGMLHAFRASDIKDSSDTVIHKAGSEVFGFIPSEVLSRLKNLTATGYSHEFFIDGDVVVSPVSKDLPNSPETDNKRLLFAALGRGGKGLFGLNVTTPESFSSSDFLWEYTPTGDSSATTDGVQDATINAATDADLGYMLGRPVFVKLNNNKAAVIAGNGYNSTSGKAVLYIFILQSGKKNMAGDFIESGQVTQVIKLDTLAAGDNGLGTPGVFYADSGDTVDYIYAGDMKGNVWKFDVTDTDPAKWKVGLSGNPLFVAKDADGKVQPITAPMTIVKDSIVGDTFFDKPFVFFGTGSYFRTGDTTDTSIQSWYGIVDEDAAVAARTSLTQRTVSAPSTFGGKPVRAFSAAVTGDMVGKKGWYIDFTNPAGERMVTESVYFTLAVPVLVASSVIPDGTDPCKPGGSGYLNVISPFTGGSVPIGILDVDNNKNFTNDLIGTLFIGSVDLGVGMPSRPTLIGNQLVVGGTNTNKPIASVTVNTGLQKLKGRISWREIVRD